MSVKEKKQKNAEQFEDIRYSETIPEEILNELTPEIIEQYFIWDEVTKRELELYPWLILPLIREVFHKVYPEGIEIKLISTEYVVRRIHKRGNSTLESIYADIAVQIGNRDIYHLECQMKGDKEMVLRMLEYDIHIGMVHGIKNPQKDSVSNARLEVLMPRSVILYLSHTGNAPAEEICLIRFSDGTSHEYRVPVVKVQDYTPEMIRNRHLNMLIPFLPIRFRKHINKKKNGIKIPVSEAVRKNLTEFIWECIMIIDREKSNGTLTDVAGKDIIEFLSITCEHLLKDEPELKKEVHEIMEPTILLTREKADIKIKLIREEAEEKIQKMLEETEEKKRQLLEEAEERQRQLLEEAEERQRQLLEEAEEKKRQLLEEAEERQRQLLKDTEEKREDSIKKAIARYQKGGQGCQEVKECIKDIFSMEEAEAEEKMEKYWKA